MSIYPETLDIKPLNLSSKYKDFQQIVDEYNQNHQDPYQEDKELLKSIVSEVRNPIRPNRFVVSPSETESIHSIPSVSTSKPVETASVASSVKSEAVTPSTIKSDSVYKASTTYFTEESSSSDSDDGFL